MIHPAPLSRLAAAYRSMWFDWSDCGEFSGFDTEDADSRTAPVSTDPGVSPPTRPRVEMSGLTCCGNCRRPLDAWSLRGGAPCECSASTATPPVDATPPTGRPPSRPVGGNHESGAA